MLSALWRLQGNQSGLQHAKHALYLCMHPSIRPNSFTQSMLLPGHRICILPYTQQTLETYKLSQLSITNKTKIKMSFVSYLCIGLLFSGMELRTCVSNASTLPLSCTPNFFLLLKTKQNKRQTMANHAHTFLIFPLISPEDPAWSIALPVLEILFLPWIPQRCALPWPHV